MSEQNRSLLEATLFNLRYDMDLIGEVGLYDELSTMTDAEIEQVLNDLLCDL